MISDHMSVIICGLLQNGPAAIEQCSEVGHLVESQGLLHRAWVFMRFKFSGLFTVFGCMGVEATSQPPRMRPQSIAAHKS